MTTSLLQTKNKERAILNNKDNIRFIKDKLETGYYTGGQGEPLIILHGGANNSTAWIDNISELAKNYTVYLPDLPGFGHNRMIEDDYGMSELIEFVERFSRNMNLDSFHLMGHSLGGGIGLNYAMKYPQKVKKLVLVSSLCLGEGIAWWIKYLSHPALIRSLGTLAINMFKAVSWTVEKSFLDISFIPPFSKASMLLWNNITTPEEQNPAYATPLSEVRMPTLIVWGAKDPIVSVESAYIAAKSIPGCQLVVFEECSHSVYKQNIAQFTDSVVEFLN